MFSMLVVTNMMAQDIYSVGNYIRTTDSNTAVGLYKNGSRITDRGSVSYNFDATDVLFRNDTCYFSYKNTTTGRSFIGAYPGPTNVPYFDAGAGSTINAMCIIARTIYSIGYKKNNNGIYRACLWENNDTTPRWIGNNDYPSYSSCATACCIGQLKGGGSFWTISVGYQYTSSSVYKGVVWKYNTVLMIWESI